MTSWYKKLFETEIHEEYKIKIKEDLKKEFQNFYNDYQDNLDTETKKLLNDWYYSEEGQKELLRFTKDLWFKLNNTSLSAMPAHDARHALYKVPTYSLKYIESEKVEGWERVGLIGALGHDYGRWSEEHIFGNAQKGSMHSRMSYVLLKEILEDYKLPIQIKKTILNSVLKHTTGANETESMPIKLTVSPDRDQLIGPEIILRIIHHKSKEDSLNVFFDTEGQESIIQAIIKMYFSRLPGPLFTLSKELDRSYQITLVFCLMNTSIDKIMEYKKLYSNKYFDNNQFENQLAYAYKKIEEIQKKEVNKSVEEYLLELLSAQNLCPDEKYKELAVKKLENLTEKEKITLSKSLIWLNEERKIMDNEQYIFLESFSKNIKEDWLKWISKELSSNYI